MRIGIEALCRIAAPISSTSVSMLAPRHAARGPHAGRRAVLSWAVRAAREPHTERVDLIHFAAADGADLHCQLLARRLTAERILDWLDDRLGRCKEVASRLEKCRSTTRQRLFVARAALERSGQAEGTRGILNDAGASDLADAPRLMAHRCGELAQILFARDAGALL